MIFLVFLFFFYGECMQFLSFFVSCFSLFFVFFTKVFFPCLLMGSIGFLLCLLFLLFLGVLK